MDSTFGSRPFSAASSRGSSSIAADRAPTSSSPAPPLPPSSTTPIAARAPELSPPTPAPSPQPTARAYPSLEASSSSWRPKGTPLESDLALLRSGVNALSRRAREQLLQDLLADTAPIDLSPLYPLIVPRLQRDFLRTLPLELALHVLSFVDEAKTLARASAVSRHWHALLLDESTWRRMCWKSGFAPPEKPAPPPPVPVPADATVRYLSDTDDRSSSAASSSSAPASSSAGSAPSGSSTHVSPTTAPPQPHRPFSYRSHFKLAYLSEQNWVRGPGTLLSTQMSVDQGVVTSMAFDNEWIVVGMDTSKVHIFEAGLGTYVRTLAGHELGVWCLTLAGAVVVSGGSDRNVRVWDVATGRCLHVLPGHTSTVRCLRVLDARPVAVSGSRDGSIRVWDIERGLALRLLSGHRKSVRAIEVCGNKIVSGSYDTTARLWNVDTGECLHVFRGHIGEIYAVAFDGARVITGSLDSTVRVWNAETGDFLALLQGHTLLVGQMQLDPYSDLLVTAGSDGTVMVYSLTTYEALHRIKAHSQSVTSLQFDERFILSGGNDGRLKLWDTKTGAYLRDLSDPCDTVWRALVRDDKLVSLSRRDDRILMDVKTFREAAPDS
ncbi:uncharacterized protein RHOBADRAFT_36032 [Rhodotorula graminis WP1]|uniref:F-box domain-containing protein n=1 Tax=Rhodotorula graminis (strain WP1) TaxID=578459 RepID=A0A194S6Z7_RHOGW|nr:uncharacterized protein RHOBADRAFT_36032 [Rhodotorula graminis WP1]KPV75191.1 hypothetical protein RHOBADRAFT_36032 [Rhodotorula graminis WP1]